MSTGADGPFSERSTIAQVRYRRTWQLLPLAPAVVILVGILAAGLVAFAAVRQLRRESDERAAERAQILSATAAARLRALPDGLRLDALQLAARNTGALFVVVDGRGELIVDASLGPPERAALARMTDVGEGEADTAVGRTRFAAHWLGVGSPHVVIAFVRAPPTAGGEPALLASLAAFTTLLVGAAAVFAYLLGRDADVDVELLASRVHAMSKVRAEPSGEQAPVRALDEIGALTVAFNQLVGRFVQAELVHRDNLTRAESADRDRAAFLAAVSHELRSPLNAILGFTDLLMQEVDGPLTAAAREELEQVRASGAHLAELIADILELSALEGGQLKLSAKPLDLAPLVAEVLREAGPLTLGRPVRLVQRGEPSLVIEADARRVRQVLTNLVANAVKFTHQGEVSITVERFGGFAKLAIADTGPGISAADRQVIFEDFRQPEDEQKKRRGSGLGLAIARRLVEMHGGTIRVESELGRGSTFEVRIPVKSSIRKALMASPRSAA
ncbi:MAG: HAMP domain-containing histidine kinase [Myxococcales bacterium]|nr:HAMP domain-containing histidine kinase [Myxococcales bacterium]